MQQTSYSQNYIHSNQQNFDNPRTLAPSNKYDFTVRYLSNFYIIQNLNQVLELSEHIKIPVIW